MIQLYNKDFKRVTDLEYTLHETLSKWQLISTALRNQGHDTNIYYTLHDSGAGDREFIKCTTVAFDIDGGADLTKWQDYVTAISKVTKQESTTPSVIISGHGIHVIYHLDESLHWTDESRFLLTRLQMKALITQVQTELKTLGLPGHCDPGIYDRARVLRLPGLMNVKKGKPPVPCQLMQLGLNSCHLDVSELSGVSLPAPSPSIATEPGVLTNWHQASYDLPYILQECRVLQWASTAPQEVTEPVWYAIDSILGRIDGGRELIHQWSSAHPSYDSRAVDSKINQAINSAGPRTCADLSSRCDKCTGCPHLQLNTSPITLKGPDHISTLTTGFHKTIVSATGTIRQVPCYDDLVKHFRSKHVYVSTEEQRLTRVWNGSYYVNKPNGAVQAFAQACFKPSCDNKMAAEFLGRIHRSEVKPMSWFRETTGGKLNLLNGVYDLNTRRLLPHSPEYGFTSQLEFEYDPCATCPQFDAFIQSVTLGRADLKEALLRFIAYALAGERCVNELVLLMTGEGANGKSTLIRIIKALFGKALISFDPEDITKEFSRRRLDGALACVIEEMPSYRDKTFWEQLKGLSSGKETSAAKKYEDSYEFENRAKFILTCNQMSAGTDPTYGYFRRLLIVPFDATFTDDDGTRDNRIGDRIISNELPGVLNQLLAVYTRLKAEDYTIPTPAASREAKEAYMLEQDTVAMWLRENVRVMTKEQVWDLPNKGRGADLPAWAGFDAGGVPFVVVGEMHQDYIQWAETANFQKGGLVNVVHFARRVLNIFKKEVGAGIVIQGQRKVDKKNARILYGVWTKN